LVLDLKFIFKKCVKKSSNIIDPAVKMMLSLNKELHRAHHDKTTTQQGLTHPPVWLQSSY